MNRLIPSQTVWFLPVFTAVALIAQGLTTEAAIRSWNGAGGNNSWTTTANWAVAAPVAGDSLTFDGATRLAPANDFTAATLFENILFNTGASAFTLGGNSITLNGTLRNLSANVQTINLDLALSATSHAVSTSNGTLVINGVISGGGASALSNGSGQMVTLNGANTMNGTVQVNAVGSNLRLGNANALQFATLNHNTSGVVSFAGSIGTFYASGKIGNTATDLVDVNSNPVTLVLQGTGGAGSATFTGAGALMVNLGAGQVQSYTSNAGNWTGGTTVSGGKLQSSTNVIIPVGSALTVNTGGTFEMFRSAGGSALNLNVSSLSGSGGLITWATTSGTIANSTLTVNQTTNTTYSGVIDQGAALEVKLVKIGTGTLTLSGANAYAGTTTVTAGTLATTLATALSGYTTSGKVIFNSGTVSAKMGDGTTTGWSTAQVDTLLTNATKTSGALGIDTTNGDLTQWTAFTTTNFGSALGLIKLGANSLILNQANTYSGKTTVSVGTLLVNNSTGNGTGSGTVSVSSGATLGGSGTIAGATTINGILAPGNSIGQLSIASDTTWNDNDAWKFELGTSAATQALANSAADGANDRLYVTGGTSSDFLKGIGTTFTFDFLGTGSTGFYKLVDWTGTAASTFVNGDFVATGLSGSLTGTFIVDNTTQALYLSVVPEPSTWALLAFSLTTVMVLRRRRNS